MQLIHLDLAKVLFLEIPHDQGKQCDQVLANAILAKQGGVDYRRELLPLDSVIKYGDVPITSVISCAMSHGVHVVFADKNVPHPESPLRMKERNQKMDAIYNEARFMSNSPTHAGCVILFGVEHFASPDPKLKRFIGDNIDETIYWVDLSNAV